jgi:site-specific recombinase XerC
VTGSRQHAPPARYAETYDRYTAALERAGLEPDTSRNYGSRVRSYLAWLESAGIRPDPLASPEGRNRAVEEYVRYLGTVRNLAPRTIYAHLTALYSFYDNLGLGSVRIRRIDSPDRERRTPRPLDASEQDRWLQAVRQRPLARDRAIALLLFYAGLRVSELIALDVDGIRTRAGQTVVIVRAKGSAQREIPLAAPQARAAVVAWLAERPRWPQAAADPALILNRRGGRLSGRAVGQLLDDVARDAGLAGEDGRPDVPARRLRDTFSVQWAARG